VSSFKETTSGGDHGASLPGAPAERTKQRAVRPSERAIRAELVIRCAMVGPPLGAMMCRERALGARPVQRRLEGIFGEAESLIRRRLEERAIDLLTWSAPCHRTARSYCATTSTRNVLQSVRTRRVWPVT
jgi:hypothetical protein